MRKPTPLPIDPILPELVNSLARIPRAILQATPGSGKTTRVPPALYRASWRKPEDEILVLEPRRLAAKWAARRVADEMGERVGSLVGYQFRFENETSRETRIRYLTEGMLMRRLLRDPKLEGVAAVVLDEFHERHLHGDIALAWLAELQRHERSDLRIVVMSATLDTEALTRYLGDCPVIRVETRQYPVEIEHLSSAPARGLETAVRDAVTAALSRDGDILVFLPGMAEIRRAEAALAHVAGRALILPLHGELSREEQDRAMLKADRTKVILATNVAETSLTIEGVSTVIDSGLHRIASHSWWSGVPALRTKAISRASATQRAGRAGRTGPGRCLRLYTRGDHDGRAAFEVPEIQRADIAQTYLELKRLGVAAPSRFAWFEAPSPQALEAARDLLYLLGALESAAPEARLTELGRRMAEMPTHPRLARLVLEGARLGCVGEAATLSALIGESRLEQLDALEAVPGAAHDESLRRARQQLLAAAEGLPAAPATAKTHAHRLAQAALAAFPDRVAKKRSDKELLLSVGGTAQVDPGPTGLHGEYFVTLAIQELQAHGQARSQLKARSLIAIEPDWLLDLTPSLLEEKEELVWEPGRKRVLATRKMTYGALILDESPPSEPADLAEAARVLLKQGIGIDPVRAETMDIAAWMTALIPRSESASEIESALARLALLAREMPESGIADPSQQPPWHALRPVFEGKTALSQIASLDWPTEIISRATEGCSIAGRIDQLVPTQISLPSGRRARVHYSLSLAPWVESRLQDFFGMKSGPSVLNGRIMLTLHLLAPNQRAVQVTTDLKGFWEKHYPALRKELGRRYPRHAWPEDPLVAPAKKH